jgi:hypothetical protein
MSLLEGLPSSSEILDGDPVDTFIDLRKWQRMVLHQGHLAEAGSLLDFEHRRLIFRLLYPLAKAGIRRNIARDVLISLASLEEWSHGGAVDEEALRIAMGQPRATPVVQETERCPSPSPEHPGMQSATGSFDSARSTDTLSDGASARSAEAPPEVHADYASVRSADTLSQGASLSNARAAPTTNDNLSQVNSFGSRAQTEQPKCISASSENQ